MRFLNVILILIVCALTLFGCARKEIFYRDNLGNQIQLSNLQNKWLIVTYWAPWCPSCMKEIPELNRFYKRNKDKVLVEGVNFDPSESETLDTTIKKLDIRFPVLTRDPAKDWQLDEINAIPTTFIINPKGEVVKKIVGENTEEDLDKLLKELQDASKKS